MKVTLSLRPDQLARLHLLAVANRPADAGRIDVSHAVRELLDDEALAPVWRSADRAFADRLAAMKDPVASRAIVDWVVQSGLLARSDAFDVPVLREKVKKEAAQHLDRASELLARAPKLPSPDDEDDHGER